MKAISNGIRGTDYKISSYAVLTNIFEHFMNTCSNTCFFSFVVFLISQIKLIKRTEKLELDLDIEVGRAVFINNLYQQRGGEIMEPLKQFLAQKDRIEIIPSYLAIPSRLKNSPYKGER